MLFFRPKLLQIFSQGPVSQADDREAKRDTPEEGELREQRMEITIRNSPYTREDSTEDRFVLFITSFSVSWDLLLFNCIYFKVSRIRCCSVMLRLIFIHGNAEERKMNHSQSSLHSK